MPQMLWSQDFFAKGELSPLLYPRVTLNAYYQGLKVAKNVLNYPQGTAGKRFGTKFLHEITNTTNKDQIYFKSFQYLDECTYLVVFVGGFIDIYLESELIATVVSPIQADEVRLIDHTILDNRFRVATGIYPPKDLTRSAGTPNPITGVTSNALDITNAVSNGGFWPARFTTSGTLPTTSPQIHTGKTYFVRAITTTRIQIYATAQDASNQENPFTISAAGALSNVVILNSWTFSDVSFKVLPIFDFSGGYDSSTFTPAAETGYGIIITRTAGAFNFESRYVGGVFVGNSGIARITATNGTNQATVNIIQPFTSTAAIPGSEVLIAEPAWSTARGWPRKCSSFQNRAVFANTDLLTNGLWLSVINDYDDFDDTENDDDSAISWFPSSDSVNYIQFIVPYRSLTIHSNSGVFSTPLSVETAVTPKNFSMMLQEATPSNLVQPQTIDNQIIVLSGNDANAMLWDGLNNSYQTSIISIANEQLIRSPVDEAPYVDLNRAGSKYMFIINADGSLAIYQTLLAENVSGFTPAVMEQQYGNAYFRWVTSNFDGRAWFVIEREVAQAQPADTLVSASGDTFTGTAYAYDTDMPTLIRFTSVTGLTTTPQVAGGRYWWAVGTTGTSFKVYDTKEDAEEDVDAVQVVSYVGAATTIVPQPLASKFYIEEVDFDAYMDSVQYYEGSATSTLTVAASAQRFNGQEVYINGDGFGFTDEPFQGSVSVEAHGAPVEVSEAQFGYPIDVRITPMPLSIPASGNPKSSNLIEPKHIRNVTLTMADTVGGYIIAGDRTFPIALQTLNQVIPGDPPEPTTGSFEFTLARGWNDFTYDSFSVQHSEPFGFKLSGIFYKVDMG